MARGFLSWRPGGEGEKVMDGEGGKEGGKVGEKWWGGREGGLWNDQRKKGGREGGRKG